MILFDYTLSNQIMRALLPAFENQDFAMLATRIDQAIASVETLTGKLIRVYKSPPFTS